MQYTSAYIYISQSWCNLLSYQGYQWAQGQAMIPITMAEESLNSKVREVGEDFVNQIFSGMSGQEVKKIHVEKDKVYNNLQKVGRKGACYCFGFIRKHLKPELG
jgi:hypothetical protein